MIIVFTFFFTLAGKQLNQRKLELNVLLMAPYKLSFNLAASLWTCVATFWVSPIRTVISKPR